MNIKMIFLFLAFSSFYSFSYAQLKKISGQVLDNQNMPVSRATIRFTGGTKQYFVMSHENGKYYGIIDSQKDTLVICSHTSFRTASKKIEGNNVINFVLDDDFLEYNLNPLYDTIANLAEIQTPDSLSIAYEDKIFTSIEIRPEFRGGSLAIQRYFSENLNFSDVENLEHLNGIVEITFTVALDGSASNIRIEKGINEVVDQRIILLVSKMPKWRPAMQNGKFCEGNVRLSIPVKVITK